jgi:UDP-N-acetylglucosamine 2-epimerase (non-hydrolysing)
LKLLKPVIDIIAGARPNFVKIAPLLREFQQQAAHLPFVFRLIHTGQHYDHSLSQSFFDDLGIPAPHVNLEVGSGSQATQTAAIMVAYERLLLQSPCNLCLVFGDVTSTLACALTAKKMQIQVGHVEAGIRSGDRTMPEEINRLVTDSITDYFFVTTSIAQQQLVKEGHPTEKIFPVGNLMIDNLLNQLPQLKAPAFFEEQLAGKDFLLLTLHRPSNVDDSEALYNWLSVIANAVGDVPVVFPVHPRTKAKLAGKEQAFPKILFLSALPYLEFVYLLKHAVGVITDSGGITEEASVLNIPCITLRDTTERPETITLGTNILAGTKSDDLPQYLSRILAHSWKKAQPIPYWDGRTSERITSHLINILAPNN